MSQRAAPTTEVNHAAATALLGQLFTAGDWIEYQGIAYADGRPTDRRFAQYPAQVPDLLAYFDSIYTTHSCFIGPAPRTAASTNSTDGTCRWLWVDIDPKPDATAPNPDAALNWLVDEHGLEPTITVRSGRGLHLYYHTTDAVPDTTRKRFVNWGNDSLPAEFGVGFDKAVTNHKGLMRLPGWPHLKGAPLPTGIEDHTLGLTPLDAFPQADAVTTDARQRVEGGQAVLISQDRNGAIHDIAQRVCYAAQNRTLGFTTELVRLLAKHCIHPDHQWSPDERDFTTIPASLSQGYVPGRVLGERQIDTDNDLIEAWADALQDRVMFVVQDGAEATGTWREWRPARGVWLGCTPDDAIIEWLKTERQGMDAEQQRTLNRYMTASAIGTQRRAAESRNRLPTHRELHQIDTEDLILPCSNAKYVHLGPYPGPLRVTDADPAMAFTRGAGVAYDPDAKCPRLDAVIEFAFSQSRDPAGMAEYFGKQLYYMLTAINSSRLFFVWDGGGRNGKSLIANTVQQLLGEFASAGKDGNLTGADKGDSHNADLCALMGSRLQVYDEYTRQTKFDNGQIKRLTGGNATLSGRPPFGKHNIPVRLTAKHLVVTNEFPKVEGSDQAFGDRLRMLHFGARVADEQVDHGLPDALTAELPGILNWILQYRHAFHANPSITPPEEMRERAESYLNSHNEELAFATECCTTDGVDGPVATGTTPCIKSSQFAERWLSWSGRRLDRSEQQQVMEKVAGYLNATAKNLTVSYERARGSRGQHIVGAKIVSETKEAIYTPKGSL